MLEPSKDPILSQKNIEKWMIKQEKKLKSEEGRFKKYPRTIIMMFGLALVAALLMATIQQALFPPAPSPPVQMMTVFGFLDFMTKVEFPAIFWVAIFGFLWLTKW